MVEQKEIKAIIKIKRNNFKKLVVKTIFGLLTVILLSGCANQLPPGGGSVDTTPPEIIEIYPPDGTVNYNENFFELTFSEYVDKRTVKDAIFISPPIEGNLELNWTNKTVTVYFPEKLKENVTYNITIGTDVVDYNNHNRMGDAVTFAFSTGDKIDFASIEGTVYTDKSAGVMLLAYNTNQDSINPGNKKADYISQSGTKGEYKLSRLAFGSYRVFAVKDEYRDLLFQSEQDLIGIPYTDVILTPEDTITRNINFELAKIDTTSPRLFSAVMTDINHLLVTFSEELDTSSYKVENFILYDSTNNRKIPLSYIFKGKAKEKELFISFNDSINVKHDYYLSAENITDRNKNFTHYDFVSVTAGERPDSTAPGIFRIDPPNRHRDVDFLNPIFNFYFDDGFDIQNLYENIFAGDTLGNQIKTSFRKVDDSYFQIKAVDKLKPSSFYIMKINLSLAKDAAGNKSDSVFVYNFNTTSGLDFTGLSGQIVNIDFKKNPILELRSISKPGVSYIQSPKENGLFEFKRIEPGGYKLICYLDEDGNGNFSPGFPFPFVPSERIKYYNEDLNLPPRWEVTNLILDFEK